MGYTKSTAYRHVSSLAIRMAVMTVLGIVVIGTMLPIEVYAYNEAMAEIWYGGDPGFIFQNQSYSTSSKQKLFHTADAATSDSVAFAFGRTPAGGLALTQTAADAFAGSQTGYFTSTATSDMIPPGRIGQGFMGTVIGDPFATGTFVGAGLIYPQMIPYTTPELAGIAFKPVLNKDLNFSMPATNLANSTKTANATDKNATAKNATGGQPTAHPAVISPGNPLYHQQNKPFSAALSWPSSPTKAKRSKVQNMSAFDRFLMNTVGRSTTDKAFNGTTSSPTYITPLKALARITPYQFMADALKMTLPGTQLMNRAWPL